MIQYDTLTIKETNAQLVSLKAYGQENKIPIIQDDTLAFILQMIAITQPKHILEIGTAIGYSSIAMAVFAPSVTITTIEKNPDMITLAKAHMTAYQRTQQITLIEGDALACPIDFISAPIDLLFIDAAKAHNIRFFERYEPYLSNCAIVIVDNVYYRNLKSDVIHNKSLKRMVLKIEQFREYIVNKEGYDSQIYPIGDGISLSIKKV